MNNHLGIVTDMGVKHVEIITSITRIRKAIAWRLARVRAIIRYRAKVRELNRQFPLPNNIAQEIRQIRAEIPAKFRACSMEKSWVLAHLVIKHDLKRTVEIGVYHGGSLFPQAVAQSSTGGLAVGIDPYSSSEANQADNREILDPLQSFLDEIDWEGMYRKVLELIEQHGLGNHCQILRMTSDQAVSLIEPEFDMLHIDGNHDRIRAVADIEHYLPKLKAGGFLVMDDVGWQTIAPEYAALKQKMKLVYEKYNPEGNNGWGILKKVQGGKS